MSSSHILIICDDVSLEYLLSYYLKGQGYLVDIARESEAGLQKCKNQLPDIILIHYSPLGPPPDELTLCRRLRDELSNREALIFLISPSREDAIQAGATEWFNLVFDVTDIAEKAKTYTG
jgi:DNA-binding response OmpR family regulator